MSLLRLGYAAPDLPWWRVFSSLMSGWRPSVRHMPIKELDGPIPSYRAIGLYKNDPPKEHDRLKEQIKLLKRDGRNAGPIADLQAELDRRRAL